ncbi:MAG: DUF501 domain-containing protein [Actinobacteria bacterium]|nr:MAG: DUF501 domain-containing protein [Actinomycetota bacterium]
MDRLPRRRLRRDAAVSAPAAALLPAADAATVAAQVGRAPRDPWRVAVRCSHGFPSVIASPSVLADGTPFPTLYWLTCPFVAETASAEESAGGCSAWASRLAATPSLAETMRAADAALRDLRATESGGTDSCGSVGIAGQRDPLATKCIHAHAALALAGLADPIGTELLERTGRECTDARCANLTEDIG